ncbi:acyltransferase [Desulfoluna butyratoxydans]|uniref:Trimeric lpxa-like n=1 Tax=Desulfoluna butyratoxydans TaxID=231438 RepID=A0A4U8YRH0_9BACT|nr:acyltransferase [Desulfoluna butyratoxydans]VFQ46481.1 trimeric lpxa-like [Desulfoluna butyratoxydans]
MKFTQKIMHMTRRLRLLADKGYYPAYLRHQGVRIGKDAVILYPSYIDGRMPYLVEIGDNVVISLNVTILTHDATSAWAGDLIKVGRVTIKDHCFIGAGSTILCNTTIGPNAIVGAGSVVSRDIPPDTVYAGSPARFVCSMEEFTRKSREAATHRPLMEGRHFQHPYIPQQQRDALKQSLDEGFGYFCARLPDTKEAKG